MLVMPDLPSLPSVIASHGLMARKALGQHFLLDARITAKIARHAGELKGFNVIEIGPGPGGLTRALLAAGASEVYVIEKDQRCLGILHDLQGAVGNDRLHLLHGDALDIDLLGAVPAPRKIVANLPYNAATAMLLKWLGDIYHVPHGYASLTLMFQKEVAQRIVASPGGKAYGRLSVLCQWLCECDYAFELPPGAFVPPPKVCSAVVTLTPRTRPLVAVRKEVLEAIVAKAFGQRRKMLRVALKGLPIQAEDLLAAAGIDGKLRAEQLAISDFCRLAEIYATGLK